MIPLAAPTNISPWVVYGLPFLSGMAGGALGSTVTWLAAGRKLARERAVDRRLEWLEGMHDSLVAVLVPLGAAYSALIADVPDHALLVSHLGEVLPALEKAQQFRHRARLFAGREAANAIQTAFEQLESAPLNVLLVETTPNAIVIAARDRIAGVGDTLLIAREDLVHEMRTHLGLDSLPKRASSFRANAVRMGLLPKE